MLGVAFGAAWTPVRRPAARCGARGRGHRRATRSAAASLLGAYALGIGVPFLLASLGLASSPGFHDFLKRISNPLAARGRRVCCSCSDCCSLTGAYTTSPATSRGSRPRSVACSPSNIGSRNAVLFERHAVAESITITDNRTGEQFELPIVNGGVSSADWRKALPDVLFYDPGFMVTAACESVDHRTRRRRRHPALPRLPNRATGRALDLSRSGVPAAQRRAAERNGSTRRGSHDITHHTYIHENMRKRFMEGFHYDAHPMGMFVSAVAAMSTFYPDAKEHRRTRTRATSRSRD